MFGIFSKERALKDSVMSTQILIKAKASEDMLKEALSIASELENLLSAYKENSYISQINKNAGVSPVKCPDVVVEVVKLAVEVAEKTSGVFDPTIGVLTQKTYGFGTGNEKLPDEKTLKEKKKLVDYRQIEISGNEILLKKRGMALDLGGIGKGFASQKITEYFYSKSVDYALVSIGGEICCYGKNWKIGINHPREKRFLAVLTTKKSKTTVSTSGDYERYIKNYQNHHILNPQTGRQNHTFSSLTLVSEGFNGAYLDAYATALFNDEKLLENTKLDFDIIGVYNKDSSIKITGELLNKVEQCVFF